MRRQTRFPRFARSAISPPRHRIADGAPSYRYGVCRYSCCSRSLREKAGDLGKCGQSISAVVAISFWRELANKGPRHLSDLTSVVLDFEMGSKFLRHTDPNRNCAWRNLVCFLDRFVRLEKREAVLELDIERILPIEIPRVLDRRIPRFSKSLLRSRNSFHNRPSFPSSSITLINFLLGIQPRFHAFARYRPVRETA